MSIWLFKSKCKANGRFQYCTFTKTQPFVIFDDLGHPVYVLWFTFSQSLLSYLAFQSFNYMRTLLMLFQKRVVHSKLDIYPYIFFIFFLFLIIIIIKCKNKQIPHCRNSSKISHCRNSSKIPHCRNSSKIPHCRK